MPHAWDRSEPRPRRARGLSSRWRSSLRAASRLRPAGPAARRPAAGRLRALRSRCRPRLAPRRPPAWRAGPPTTTLAPASAPTRWRSWALGKLGEVGLSLLHVRVATFLRLVTHVVEERRVTGELLDAGQAVVDRVEAGLQHAKRERAQLEHLPAPGHGLLLQVWERHDLVDQAHVERLLRVVL